MIILLQVLLGIGVAIAGYFVCLYSFWIVNGREVNYGDVTPIKVVSIFWPVILPIIVTVIITKALAKVTIKMLDKLPTGYDNHDMNMFFNSLERKFVKPFVYIRSKTIETLETKYIKYKTRKYKAYVQSNNNSVGGV